MPKNTELSPPLKGSPFLFSWGFVPLNVFLAPAIRFLGLCLFLLSVCRTSTRAQSPLPLARKYSLALQTQLSKTGPLDTLAVWFKSSAVPAQQNGLLPLGSGFFQWKGRRIDWDTASVLWPFEWADLAPQKGQTESLTSNSHIGLTAWVQANGIQRVGKGIRLGLNDDGWIGPHPDFGKRLKQQNASFTGALADHADQLAGMLAGSGMVEPAAQGYLPGAEVQVWNYSVDPTQNSGFFAFPSALYSDSVVVLNTSYGDGCNAGYTALSAFLDQQLELSPELGLVFSAGNSGSADCGYGAGPGWANITGGHKLAKNALVVGNILNSNLIAPSSSRGPSTDGRIKPDLVAPGNLQYTTSGFAPTGYTLQSGSSISATAATAAFALLQHEHLLQRGSFAPSSLIRAHLLNTALDLGLPGPDFTYGFGLLQSDLALTALSQRQDSLMWLNPGDTVMIPLHISGSQSSLKILLCWNDPAGSPLSASPLINDLDLAVKTPTGTWMLPLVPNPTANLLGQAALQGPDHLNTVEQISIASSDTGIFWIQITAQSLIPAGQEFALVWSSSDTLSYFKSPTIGQSASPQETLSIDFYTAKAQSNLEFSANLGQSWQVLSANLPKGNHRIDHFLNPSFQAFGLLYRLTHLGQEQIRTHRLPILPSADALRIDTLCANRLHMTWQADPAVPYWLVYAMADTNQMLVDTVSGNQWVSNQDWGGVQRYWAVAAMDIWGGIGRRCRAISAGDSLIHCNPANDLALNDIVFPPGNTLSTCLFSQNLPLTCSISNLGTQHSGPILLTAYVNGQFLQNDTLTNLAPNSTAIHTFSQTLSPQGGSEITISIRLSSFQDEMPWNNSIARTFTLYGQNETPLPYFETFENSIPCPNVSDCKAPECQATNPWKNNEGNALDWRIHNGPSPSAGTGPNIDAFPGTSNGNYLYLESSLCAPTTSFAYGPCFSGIPEPLNLYAALHAFGPDVDHMEIFLLGPSGLDSLKIKTQGSYFGWETQKSQIQTIAGAKYQLLLKGQTKTGFRGDLALDAVRLDTLDFTALPNNYPKVCQTNPTTFKFQPSYPGIDPLFTLRDTSSSLIIQATTDSISQNFNQAGLYQFTFSHPTINYNWHGNLTVENPLSLDFNWQEIGNGLVAFSPNLANYVFKWQTGDGQTLFQADTMFHGYLQNGQYLVRLWAENACGSDSIEKWIQVVGVGFSDPPSKNAWLVYPNPAQQKATVLSAQGEEIEEIHLRDLSGRSLLHLKPASAAVLLPLETLPAGYYLLDCKTKDRYLLLKLIKTNP
jgi:hypothetical protein